MPATDDYHDYRILYANGESLYELCLYAYFTADDPDAYSYEHMLTVVTADAANSCRISRAFQRRAFVRHYAEYRAYQQDGLSFAALLKRLQNDVRFSATDAMNLLMKLFNLTMHDYLQKRNAARLATITGTLPQVAIKRDTLPASSKSTPSSDYDDDPDTTPDDTSSRSDSDSDSDEANPDATGNAC